MLVFLICGTLHIIYHKKQISPTETHESLVWTYRNIRPEIRMYLYCAGNSQRTLRKTDLKTRMKRNQDDEWWDPGRSLCGMINSGMKLSDAASVTHTSCVYELNVCVLCVCAGLCCVIWCGWSWAVMSWRVRVHCHLKIIWRSSWIRRLNRSGLKDGCRPGVCDITESDVWSCSSTQYHLNHFLYDIKSFSGDSY